MQESVGVGDVQTLADAAAMADDGTDDRAYTFNGIRWHRPCIEV